MTFEVLIRLADLAAFLVFATVIIVWLYLMSKRLNEVSVRQLLLRQDIKDLGARKDG